MPEIVVDCPAWGDVTSLVEKCFDIVMKSGVKGVQPGSVAILLTDDARMAALNRAYRGQEGPTNVLSFPADPAFMPSLPGEAPSREGGAGTGAVFWGDLALCYGTCAREAAERSIPLLAHMVHLVIHGVLHLFGYDHQTVFEASRMEAIETKLLARLNIADPHESDPSEPDPSEADTHEPGPHAETPV